MSNEALMPLLATVITLLIKLWNTETIRTKIFAFVPKLPRAIQWIAPLLLSMAVAGGQGFLDGKTGFDLFSFAMGNGAEIGAMAIAIWHVGKRVIVESKSGAK